MVALIDLELTELTHRRRSVPLAHRATFLPAPLAVSDSVVLRDLCTGVFHSATVAEVDSVAGETHYRLTLGIELPEEVALDRVRNLDSVRTSQGLRNLLALIDAMQATDDHLPRTRPAIALAGTGD